MFGDDDYFKNFNERFNHDFEEAQKEFERSRQTHQVMSVVVPVVSALVLLVVLAVCCRLCCRRNRGRVLAPPTVPAGAAPYPQQQYSVAVSSYPVQALSAAPMPVPYVTHPPYTARPVHTAPYPSMAPYPAHHAHPARPAHPAPYSAPSAPDVDVQPPSYDQVQSEMKSPPYNPHYPH